MKKTTDKIEDIMVEITFAEERGAETAKGWLNSGLERLEALFSAAAFAEEGEFETARALAGGKPGRPLCSEGYYFDETSGMCAAKA